MKKLFMLLTVLAVSVTMGIAQQDTATTPGDAKGKGAIGDVKGKGPAGKEGKGQRLGGKEGKGQRLGGKEGKGPGPGGRDGKGPGGKEGKG